MGGGHRMIDKHYVMYDDIVRVPLLVRWPGVTRPGSRSDAFVLNMTDLAMTLLRKLDPATPQIHDARALQPLLDGSPPPADWRDAVVSTYNGQQFGLYTQRMLRDRRWKYIWNLTDVDELYDLQEDPAELVNRVDDPALRPMLATMRQRLWHELESWGDYPPKSQWLRAQLLEGRK
jgi:arylsulfatase A-like enzyme